MMWEPGIKDPVLHEARLPGANHPRPDSRSVRGHMLVLAVRIHLSWLLIHVVAI